MKIEKYIFCFPKALRFASKKLGITKELSPTNLQVLYAVRRLGLSTNATIIQYLRKLQNTAPDNNISASLRDLSAIGLLERDDMGYMLSPSGRELLSLIRRYLVNVRM